MGEQSKGQNLVCLTYDHDSGPSQQGKKCEEHDLVRIQEMLEKTGSICDQRKDDLPNRQVESPHALVHGQRMRWPA